MKIFLSVLFVWCCTSVYGYNKISIDTLGNGIIRLSVGTPDEHTPYDFVRRNPNREVWKNYLKVRFLLYWKI